MNTGRNLHWQDLTPPELGALAKADAAVLVPVGAIEQHGPHLPVSTDITCALAVAEGAAQAIAEFPVLVAPPVSWGVSPHHMGFPGTITLSIEVFVGLLCDICRSITRHGFRRILLINGHGGNAEAVGLAAQKLSSEGIFVAATTYFGLITEDLRVIGESPLGGMSHACEMETSLLLKLCPDLVHMDLARPDVRQGHTSFFTWDMRDPRPIYFAYDMKRDSTEGVIGDPTLATLAKGEQIYAAAVARTAAFLREFQALRL